MIRCLLYICAVLLILISLAFGFTESNKNLYLQNDESVYIMRWGDDFGVYLYKYDPVTKVYTGRWINYLDKNYTPITIHFVEQPESVCKQDRSDKSQ